MRNKVLILFILGILGISLWYFMPKGSDKILSQLNIETSDIKEIVTNLDQRIDEPSNIGARITGDKLYLYNNDKEYSLNLPEDSFFVSIAPYINEVHPCTIHNLVSCRGEIYNQSMKVRVVDEDNQIILDEVKVTQENGFIGLWLPKNINATLRVEYDGLFVEYPLSTYSESDTCITTPLKLELIKF